ncbi:MAG: MBL fold metallo-hydrolase [Verrucomicrobiales bacterium]
MKPLSPARCTLFSASLLLSTGCANRPAPYRGGEDNLLVGEPATEAPPLTDGVGVTYLGTNGYLIQSPSTAILVDPYFSRIDRRRVLFNAPIAPSADAIAYASRQAQLPDRVDGFLVTHSHFDHLFDVPALQRQLGGKIVTSPTGTFLSMAEGVESRNVVASMPGQRLRLGDASVRVLPARHDRVLGVVPYPQSPTSRGAPGSASAFSSAFAFGWGFSSCLAPCLPSA